jgi:hypothetical protein
MGSISIATNADDEALVGAVREVKERAMGVVAGALPTDAVGTIDPAANEEEISAPAAASEMTSRIALDQRPASNGT